MRPHVLLGNLYCRNCHLLALMSPDPSEVFEIRTEFLNAVWLLGDYAEEQPTTEAEIELVKNARLNVYSRGVERDPLLKRLNQSIEILESLLGPTIRLNEQSKH